MFEHYTYETLLDRMLSLIPDNLDKREGSVIFDSLAPVAKELELAFQELERAYLNSYSDTANRDHLIKRALDRGIKPLAATHAVVKGEFDMFIPIGARFSCESLNFVCLERMYNDGKFHYFSLRCETPGREGGLASGRLKPITRIHGLGHAEIVGLIKPGEDEEDTEALRERYYREIRRESFGGNITDYKDKVKAIPGVGGCKVIPVWRGPGTVKLIITDSDHKVPSAELLGEVQTAVDPLVNQGKGIGTAPIDHTVTAVPARYKTIDIECDITLRTGTTWLDIEADAKKLLEDYVKELRATWERYEDYLNDEVIHVRVSQVDNRLLSIDDVLDVQNTTINGVEENAVLAIDEVPLLGKVVAHERD